MARVKLHYTLRDLKTTTFVSQPFRALVVIYKSLRTESDNVSFKQIRCTYKFQTLFLFFFFFFTCVGVISIYIQYCYRYRRAASFTFTCFITTHTSEIVMPYTLNTRYNTLANRKPVYGHKLNSLLCSK